MENPEPKVTLLLQRACDSKDPAAVDELYRAVKEELHRVAEALLRPGHTLQATVLINEAIIRLVCLGEARHWEDRRHLYRLASGVMRRVLRDDARRRRPARLNGDEVANLRAGGPAPDERLMRAERLLALDRALNCLAAEDPEAAEALEMLYFGGLRLGLGKTPEQWSFHASGDERSPEKVADELGLARATMYRRLRRARRFLKEKFPELAD